MQSNNPTLFNQQDSNSWAEVILPMALPMVYTYLIPNDILPQVKIGCRVEVVFGNQKKYTGIVKSILNTSPAFATKPILSVIDEHPLIYPHQLKLWNWMSEYYMCSEGEVMTAALPANFKLNSETILLFNEDHDVDFQLLEDDEFVLAEALSIKKQLQLFEIQQILSLTNNTYLVVKSLLEKNICFTWEKLTDKYIPKKETYIQLHSKYEKEEELATLINSWKNAPKQLALLLSYLHFSKTETAVTKKALLKKSNASEAQLKSLIEKNILLVSKKNIDRIQHAPKEINIDFQLSDKQQLALNKTNEIFTSKNVCLLHGITGSGKTLLYIKLIEQIIIQGKQVLYLLPEIALTTQIIRRLQKHFGGHIAVYHSKFNDQERVELWNKIRNGEISVVLGARSALFLPFNNLGLIIVDEEHDASFKQQDPAPRYHARDTAIYYASLFNAKVLLGSGTPSLESYFNAKEGKYGLVHLDERYGGIQLPHIEIINTTQVAQKGKVMISPQLKEAIQETLDNKKQIILFQNRRGYNPYLICGTCGIIPQCNHCDVSLTVHKYSNKLHCHYCGSIYPKLVTCVGCGSTNWLEKNFGTEKIEEQLEQDFKDYRIGRMDVDTVKGKTAHDTLIQSFEQQKLDVLVGTQMVVKGLDFDNVSLVGILDADGLLSFADFRVNERAFQLMEQVSGRAGRKGSQGKVLIQTMNVNHPVIQWVQAHDYAQMYLSELPNRKEFLYPPFSRLITITLKHKDNEKVKNSSNNLAASLRLDFKQFVMGPAQPIIGRVRNQYLMEIIIKLPKDAGLTSKYKKAIQHHLHLLQANKSYKAVVIVMNVDPV